MKFEFSSFFSLGDMKSQRYGFHEFRYLAPENGFNIKNKLLQNPPLQPKTDPPPPFENFSSFLAEEIFFHFQNFEGVSMRKEPQPPLEYLILVTFYRKMR